MEYSNIVKADCNSFEMIYFDIAGHFEKSEISFGRPDHTVISLLKVIVTNTAHKEIYKKIKKDKMEGSLDTTLLR